MDKKRDLLGALKYWKRAMDLRYMDSNNVVHKPEPKQLIMAYDYAKEVSPALHRPALHRPQPLVISSCNPLLR